MTNRLVLFDLIVAHLIGRFTCTNCGAPQQSKLVHHPVVSRHGDQVALRFRVECACGQAGWLRVNLPVLLFGYLLAWQVLFQADRRARTPHAPVPLIGHQSKLFPGIIAEYVQLVGRLPAAGAEPTCADQVAFELNDEEWANFLRRLGFDRNDSPSADS